LIISTSSHNILLSPELDEFVADTMRNHFDRFSDNILSIDVFLKDINGPEGGIDKQVIARIHLRNGRQLVVETVDANLHAAIRRSAKCAKRAARRSLRKSRRIEKFRVHTRLDDGNLLSRTNA